MLKECFDIFNGKLELEGDDLILNEYIPSDGTYLIVDKSGDISDIVNLEYNKKEKTIDNTNSNFSKICFRDYYSKLIDMNKPQDPKKIIHSNNYFSFYIKKENLLSEKLNEEIIKGYYDILLNPEKKYEKSKKSASIYSKFEDEYGNVNHAEVEKNKDWILNNIFSLAERIDMTKKNYLKIFFEANDEEYEREGLRYFIPNIYNSNDYNIVLDEETFGLPNDNMGMNAKKPYLGNKTRKIELPYMLDLNEVMTQKKFFDYLMVYATKGFNNVFVNFENKTFNFFRDKEQATFGGASSDNHGMLLRIQKGKELEIHYQSIISTFEAMMTRPFEYKNILEHEIINSDNDEDKYDSYKKRMDLERIIDSVFFSKYLRGNYFRDVNDIKFSDNVSLSSFVEFRESIFDWVYNQNCSNNAIGMKRSFDKLSERAIDKSIENGYMRKAMRQLNLRWSILEYFEGGNIMSGRLKEFEERLRENINTNENFDFATDEDYYFAVGQLANYFISRSKSGKLPHSQAKPIFNSRNDIQIKEQLRKLFVKYSYDDKMISKRFKQIYSAIEMYSPETGIDKDIILAGYFSKSLFYEKSGSAKEEESK